MNLKSIFAIALTVFCSIVFVGCGDDNSSSVNGASVNIENSSSSFESSSSIPSNNIAESSSSSFEKTWSRLNPEINYGEFVDERDGQVYKTTKIGNQVWMAENLNYSDKEKTPSLVDRSSCYYNDLLNCQKFGRLYTWAAMIDSVKLFNDKENPQKCGFGESCTLPAKIQGICPKGWHVPDTTEWVELFNAVGGKDVAARILKSKDGWRDWDDERVENSIDSVGFSGLAGGGRNGNGYFSEEGHIGCFWSAVQEDEILAYGVGLGFEGDFAGMDHAYKHYEFSVRCLKD